MEQWNRTYGSASFEGCYSVIQTSDGGYALAGSIKDGVLSDLNFWLVKTDASGVEQWNQSYGGMTRAYLEVAYSVIQTSDGGYALAGISDSYSAGGDDGLLVKTDASGVEEWSQAYVLESSEEIRSVVQTKDGGYALAGSTDSLGAGSRDFWLNKTDQYGVVPEFPTILSLLISLTILTAVVLTVKRTYFSLLLSSRAHKT